MVECGCFGNDRGRSLCITVTVWVIVAQFGPNGAQDFLGEAVWIFWAFTTFKLEERGSHRGEK